MSCADGHLFLTFRFIVITLLLPLRNGFSFNYCIGTLHPSCAALGSFGETRPYKQLPGPSLFCRAPFRLGILTIPVCSVARSLGVLSPHSRAWSSQNVHLVRRYLLFDLVLLYSFSCICIPFPAPLTLLPSHPTLDGRPPGPFLRSLHLYITRVLSPTARPSTRQSARL